ncbi:MAG: type II toxin-antitoxin system RelE/ParE family toxin [Aquabacterium sp.]|uniref:type II toxin-antitoxin system RelE/ParE family toxin n=1 Tax=Aquabacterium sp. TaxID=1872578 RepID=UPI003BB15F0C
MAEALYRVELTDSFIVRLDSIEAFLAEADASFAFEDLLTGLRATVVPNLVRFPLMGRRYLNQPPQSVEALEQLSKLPAGAADSLRVYLDGNYLMLYAVMNEMVYLLSIRHHRQLSFDFSGLWPA